MANYNTTANASGSGGATSGTGDRTATVTTPVVNDLWIVACFVSTNTNDAPTCSDNQGGTYTLVGTPANQVLPTSENCRLSIFVRNALISSTSSTTVTVATGSNTSGAIHVLPFSGMTRAGIAAIRSQGLQNNQAAGPAAPVLNQSALTGNPTIVIQGSADTTTTAPTNWIERFDTNFATPTIALETATRDSGFTGTTITFGAASSTAFCSYAIELDTSVQAGQPTMRRAGGVPGMNLNQGFGRSW